MWRLLRRRHAFLARYRGAGVPVDRAERVLAVGRAFLTVTGLGAIYLDPTEPSRLAALTYSVLAAYAIYSLVVLLGLHRIRIHRGHALALLSIDIAWVSVLTTISDGPISPFFLFFLFVVVSAAYRWGLWETVLTATVTTIIFVAQAIVIFAGPWQFPSLLQGDFDLTVTIVRANYLLVTGFLLGYLAQQEKELRAEAAAIADVGRQPRIDLGVTGSVGAVASGLMSTFEARAIGLVVRDEHTGRVRLWRLRNTDSEPSRRELMPADEAEWLFDDPGLVWHVENAQAAESSFRVTQAGAWPLRTVIGAVPWRVCDEVTGSRTLTAVNMGLPGEWHGRAYLYDMPRTGALERRLHLLAAMTMHISPALTNVLLLQRLQSELSAETRARVARELHDGAIQTLIGIQMTVQGMRRLPLSAADVDLELAQLEQILQREVASLRRLMDALRPVELDAGETIDAVLAGVVERFRRDSGIAARFVGSGPVHVTPASALELLRITQEALMNIRKHSGAHNVLVRLTGVNGVCELWIEDDGVGFEFDGRWTLDQLTAARLGPTVIKERARLLNAELAIESTPGSGSRLHVRFAEELGEPAAR